VATDAQPREVRKLFGFRRTLAVGASFGVITVLGPKGAGQIEVATFREDAGYSDGRHPDEVRFSTAKEDASRRDFTINGLFYDPIEDQVIDYVGGQQDLDQEVVRAIGNPQERFTEDKLRMLRAVRFTASFGFQLEPQTLQAIRQMAHEIQVVSPERISAEMRQILTDGRRRFGLELLIDSGLAAAILPEVTAALKGDAGLWRRTLDVLGRLDQPGFPLAMAVTVSSALTDTQAQDLGVSWRLSNKEIDRIVWLLKHHGSLDGAHQRPWSAVQRILVADGAADLLDWMEAERLVSGAGMDDVAWCREQLGRPHQEINPPPLLTGGDLIAQGVPRGPVYRELLDQVRDAQLDCQIDTPEAALELVDHILKQT
jgi:tRNA nucleotidyltransferase/poly(A) polymerase